ncbi:hypothetical protein BKA66DRAFT_438432 [Pyrenochaeta sp. MPI-SDFR-AT-0127]|nr:hypothetical protein BKA66DRAFT_438432 [Pyrenochaeta sp. MPI-SDFR-AT-0127]
MALLRRFQSVAIAFVSTTLFLVLLQVLAENTSFTLIHPVPNNSSPQLIHPGLRPYIPERIWRTPETLSPTLHTRSMRRTGNILAIHSLMQKDCGLLAPLLMSYPSDWDGKVVPSSLMLPSWLQSYNRRTLLANVMQPTDSTYAKMLAYAQSAFPQIHLEPVNMLSTSKGDAT